MQPSRRLLEVGALLREVRDILDERVQDPAPPRWAEGRGWADFLRGLDEATLERCEHGETAVVLASIPAAPESLRELARRVTAATEVPPAPDVERAPTLRRASERKRRQVATLGALVREWAPRARRVVDLGAGHGHLTRALAESLGLEALGVEERAHVVSNARALTESEAVRFVEQDALSSPIALSAEDLVVGLHACGALGDGLVRAAAASGAGVLLVSCCPQKVPGAARSPLSGLGARLALTVSREHLGLANVATLAQGGVDSARVMERRRTRRGLYVLLRDAGVELQPGDEMHGIPRRRLREPFDALAARAFAIRGMPAPGPSARADASARGAREHEAIRRFGAPRTMLGRLLELALVLDRATLLEEQGGACPSVQAAFEREASPRNLAILRAPHGRMG